MAAMISPGLSLSRRAKFSAAATELDRRRRRPLFCRRPNGSTNERRLCAAAVINYVSGAGINRAKCRPSLQRNGNRNTRPATCERGLCRVAL